MIFNLRYKNKNGVENLVQITVNNSVFGTEEVEGTERPFVLKYSNEKSDKSGYMRTSSAEINIYETPNFNIDALKTSSETDIAVSYFVGGVLKWKGFVLPDFFSREIGGNGEVNMTASDRISALKDISLDVDNMEADITIRNLAEQCLSKAGYSLPLYTLADFVTDTGVPFFNTLISSQRLKSGNSSYISCYDILRSICVASNSILIQRNGAWFIVNKRQHEIGSGKLYSSATEHTNWSSVIVPFDEITKGAVRTIIPVASSVGVYHEFGGGLRQPENYNFAKDLSGWNISGNFSASINNKEVKSFTKNGANHYIPVYGEATENKYLVNYLNDVVENSPNKYLYSNPIPIANFGTDKIKITLNINATGIRPPNITVDGRPSVKPSFVSFGVFATNGETTYALKNDGAFEKLKDGYSAKDYIQKFDFPYKLRDWSIVNTIPGTISGVLSVGRNYIDDYKITIRIYGSGSDMVSMINGVFVTFDKDSSDDTKGNLYKTASFGESYTKSHDVDTSIFGDYLSRGLSGYFYEYRSDDTSSLLLPSGEKTSKWSAPEESELFPLLQQVSRQKARMFSIAHDIISGEIDIESFDPLVLFEDCNGRLYTIISAEFDFFHSVLTAYIEEVGNNLLLSRRDYIYSYFSGDSDSITSVGSIGAGSSGGNSSGGGMTTEQIAALNEVAGKAHEHDNKEVLDKIKGLIKQIDETGLTDENILSALRTILEIENRALSKTKPDTAADHIEFKKGLTSTEGAFGNVTIQSGLQSPVFVDGFLGEGFKVWLENGKANAVLDNLTIRKNMSVYQLVIQKIQHVGGAFMFSAASGEIERIVELPNGWQCYLKDPQNNDFQNFDQVICQTFTKNKTKRYFRAITQVGTDYVQIVKNDAEAGSAIPEVGDTIVQLGNRSNAARRNAIYISSYGTSGPYMQFLSGIDSFDLTGKVDSQIGKETFFTVDKLEIRSADGKKERVARDRGEWVQGTTYYYYDRVSYNGALWLCMINNTTDKPSETSGGWEKQTNVQVGGKNLLREYDLHFGGKYWGVSSLVEGVNFVKVDLDAVMANLKYLNVSPSQITWVYPEFEANIAIKSNTDWANF